MAYELENVEMSSEDALSHHGIFGQRWGKRNGPPYPLAENAHSAKEKKMNNGKYARNSEGTPVKSENTPDSGGSHGGSGGGGGQSNSPRENANPQNNQRQNDNRQNNNQRPNNSENTGNNSQNNQQHHSRDNRESREYERNLNLQKKLNDQQYKQLMRYQNDINRQQKNINKQQRQIENQKAEVYRKELTNTQKERELREIRKQQRKVGRQQYFQQRNIRSNNEKLLDAQLEQFRTQQGYGNPKNNVSFAPPVPQYNFSVPTMTVDDYRRYRAKKNAIKTAKKVGKGVAIGTAAIGVTAALGAIGAGVLAGNVSHRTVRKVKGILDANPRTVERLVQNTGEAVGDSAKGFLKIGKSVGEALGEGLESRKARKFTENIFETGIKASRKGKNRLHVGINKKFVAEVIDGIGDNNRRIRNNIEKVGENLGNTNTYKKIGKTVKDVNVTNSANRSTRSWLLGRAKLSDKVNNKTKGSIDDLRKKVRLRKDGTEAPLMNYLAEHPEKINERIERAIRLERGSKGVNDLLGSIKTRRRFLDEGDSSRDWIINNTGVRGLFNKTVSKANDASDSFNRTMSTYKKTKGVMTTLSGLTVGAALAKRSKRKEQQMRDRIEEEMLDEYFFGRYR